MASPDVPPIADDTPILPAPTDNGKEAAGYAAGPDTGIHLRQGRRARLLRRAAGGRRGRRSGATGRCGWAPSPSAWAATRSS